MIEVFILTNGNSSIGMGHIYRSILLVTRLRESKIKCSIISYHNSNEANVILEKCASHYPLNEEESIIESPLAYLEIIKGNKEKVSVPLLIIDSDDSYLYNEKFQKSIIENGVKLMYITLYDTYHYYANIVLNQNILALNQNFKGETYTKFLLGPNYFMWPEKASVIVGKVKINKTPPFNLFVNFGNADPNNVTHRIIEILKENLEWFNKVTVVVGGHYRFVKELKNLVESVTVIKLVVNSDNIYSLMENCDLAICSLGLTFWELTKMNIPSLIIAASNREKPVCNYMEEENYAYKLGEYSDLDWRNCWQEKLLKFKRNELIMELQTERLSTQINSNGSQLVTDEIKALA